MTTKICSLCKMEKPLTEFTTTNKTKGYKDPRCKDCNTLRRKQYRAANLDKQRELDRLCYQRHRESVIDKRKTDYADNFHEIQARRIASYAKQTGLITEKPCERCGKDNADMHHTDYNKPFDVIFLCRSCHVQEHYKQRRK